MADQEQTRRYDLINSKAASLAECGGNGPDAGRSSHASPVEVRCSSPPKNGAASDHLNCRNDFGNAENRIPNVYLPWGYSLFDKADPVLTTFWKQEAGNFSHKFSSKLGREALNRPGQSVPTRQDSADFASNDIGTCCFAGQI